eukprot:CAMPEP_0181299574 /NCGR_PEP_ID=MMETSP1101-20121128/6422_1 /TAXON_ID=46948 /ORGANISM="Rhodomonas abbreviata, Strain Caron Lab Isolate" /LENGTH=347 /DNA_ID=CAMNT_0023404739 /DNA_START=7 /DNA_END=1048 /DNA_ORIENTATION=-
MTERHETLFGLLGRLSLTEDRPPGGVRVEAEVHNFLSEVKVTQWYKNTEAETLTAKYYFPLDEAASVCAFQAEYEDGTVVDGIVREKGAAKREYLSAVKQGKSAQLLESLRPDIFLVSVGNIEPGASIKIKLTYVAPLKNEGKAARFLLPTHVALRYSPTPGSGLPAECSSRALPFTGMNISVKFFTKSQFTNITSPTHGMNPSLSIKSADKVCEATLQDMALDRDLVLLCQEENPHQPEACIELSTDGTMAGVVTFRPEIEFREVKREIIFLVDRSGSMNDMTWTGRTNMENAREALLLFLRSLPPHCSFNIVGFGSSFTPLFPVSRPYDDESLQEAVSYAASMQP